MTDLTHWTPRPRPDGRPLEGRFVRLERLDAARHAPGLAEAVAGPGSAPLYDYLFDPPPKTVADVVAWTEAAAKSADPFYYAVIDTASGRVEGRLAFMRIEPAHGVIEVGSILYGPRFQKTAGATEVQFLFARHAFEDLGYRRYEWKCNDRNEASKRAARRLGFNYEGLFRQHMVVKGRNRDTAWYAIMDGEWPARRRAFEAWLDPANFDAAGRQLRRLEDCR